MTNQPTLLEAQERARKAGCVINKRGSIRYWLDRAKEAEAAASNPTAGCACIDSGHDKCLVPANMTHEDLKASIRGDSGAVTQPQYERRGTMCSGSTEKVDGLILIQSISDVEQKYALVSPALADELLQAVNGWEAMRQVAACALADLEGIMPEFEPSGDRTHPAWLTIGEIRAALALAEGKQL